MSAFHEPNLFSLPCLAGFSAGVFSFALSAQAQPALFSDTFTSGASPLWNNLRGGFYASGGVYDAQFPNNTPPTYTALPFELSDFSFDVDVNQAARRGRLAAFGRQRPERNSARDRRQRLGSGPAGQRSRHVHLLACGDERPLWRDQNEAHNVIAQPGVDNLHLHVEVVGNVYSAFVNGASAPVTTLVDNTYSSGRVGLYDFSGQTFDNVVLQVPSAPVGPFLLAIAASGPSQADALVVHQRQWLLPRIRARLGRRLVDSADESAGRRPAASSTSLCPPRTRSNIFG